MTQLADETAYFAPTDFAVMNFAFLTREPRGIIFPLIFLFAGFAMLTPWAEARQSGLETANLSLHGLCSGGYQGLDYDPGAHECDSPALTSGSVQDAAQNKSSYAAGLNVCPATPDGGVVSGKERNGCGQNSTAQDSMTRLRDQPGADSSIQPLEKRLPRSQPPDFNRDIYYRNKLEFSLDVGWLPINIPFPFDVFEGDPYNLYPLRYTLVPVVASLRWQLDSIGSPWILRGNWDLTFSASATAIPRGAETHYFSYDMGIRRNFVPRNSRAAPYLDMRLGMGLIDAKGPLGVYYAQGQNLTFTCNLGSGVRYNVNSRYAISAGLNWMHISNNNLSAPQYSNYGINVYGPVVGIDVQLRRHSRHSGL